MSEFTQQTFLGASISSFNANIGFGNQVSTLDIVLVEDDKQNDYFLPPAMGYPCTFLYNDWRFDGLLNNIQYSSGQSTHRTINVTLVDPRQILEGVQIILNKYTGSVNSIYNIYNVYGYLELNGFGSSQVNDAGMPWYLLTQTLDSMIDEYPIRHLGIPFFIDLSELPLIDISYRISNTNITLMDLITELCETASCDFFIELVGNIIKLRTISRTYQPATGRIQAFIDSLGMVNEKRVGFEAEYHPVGKFLVGGQVEQLYYAYNPAQFVADPKTEEEVEQYTNINNYILPYWGKYANGNVILTDTANEEIRLNIPAEGLDYPGYGFGSYYPTDTGEMSAALAGFESWRRYLCERDEDNTSIHFGKATRLKMSALNVNSFKNFIINLNDDQIRALKPDTIFNFGKLNADITADEVQQRFFTFIQSYAEEYYGKKFMVKLPHVSATIESETGLFKTSVTPIESAYVEESAFVNAVANGLLPANSFFLKDEFNKFYAYVRFDDLVTLDISGLSADDYVISGTSVFVKCSVEPELVFVNYSTASGPRAVLTLPGAIYRVSKTDYLGFGFQTFIEALSEKGYPAAEILNIVENINKRVGMEILYDETMVVPLFPRFAAVPLRDNTTTYGPWYSFNALGGAMEFEQNEELVPWNFGGYTGMNAVALASVNDPLYNRNINESGNIVVPGAPTVRLGSLLITLGPYVTGVSVSVGDGGVTTTYDMNSWSVRPGKIQRYQTEKFKRFVSLRRDQLRIANSRFKNKNVFGAQNIKIGSLTRKKKNKQAKHKPHTSSLMFVGEIVGSGSNQQAIVATSPLYNSQLYLENDTNYTKKGGVSLDGLFRPFSTNPSDSGTMPSFVTPVASATTPTVSDLNPYKTGHDVSVILTGTTRPDDLSRNPLEAASIEGGRGIALKGPVVIAGWGYDTDGNTVGTVGNMNSWKCGPLDVRWDNDRGVWAANNESVIVKMATITGSYIGKGASGRVSSVAATIPGYGTQNISDEAYRNFLVTNEKVMCILSDGQWKILGENGLERRATVVSNITAGSFGNCTLAVGGITIQAFYTWMDTLDDIIYAGTEVNVKFYPEDDAWFIVGAACSE